MGKYLAWLSGVWLFCVNITLGQAPIPNDSLRENKGFIDVMPEYPGGNEALYKFVGNNFKYPKQDLRNNIEGKIITKFMIDTNGYVRDIIIVKSLSPSSDAEAIRVLQLMPRWKPGMQNNKKVNVYLTLPIKLELPEVKPITPKQALITETIGALVGITLTLVLVGWYRRTF